MNILVVDIAQESPMPTMQPSRVPATLSTPAANDVTSLDDRVAELEATNTELVASIDTLVDSVLQLRNEDLLHMEQRSQAQFLAIEELQARAIAEHSQRDTAEVPRKRPNECTPFLAALTNTVDLVPDQQLTAFARLLKTYKPHADTISRLLYEKLPEADQPRFIQWFLKRWADISIVNPVELQLYLQTVEAVKHQPREPMTISGRTYGLLDLAPQGHDFKLVTYDWCLFIHDVYYNQYEHGAFRVQPGDVIIDAGGFVGDTAVLFHDKAKGRCEVHSFEILQENLDLFVANAEMNGISDKVVLNKLALSDTTGDSLGVQTGTLQGGTAVSASAACEERVQTIRLDDYVARSNLNRVDFVKMDIEGAEMPALRGAINTIRHFKPKLALCLYHKPDDVLTIPAFIESTGVPYDFRFKWVQLTHGWEAVLLASPRPH
jgi:FkbM family methyltransferase